MKELLCGLISLVLAIGLVFQEGAYAVPPASAANDFRAVWVASVANLDFPSKKGLSDDELKKEIDAIIARTSEMKLNAIILQVRPSGDALYKSEIFPWSEFLTGTQGVAPANGFDPLIYWIERAHLSGIELHAWINPYRVSANTTDVSRLAANNPARRNSARVVSHGNGLFYDPGLPENRQLIVDGIDEILRNYNVDGIHLDDYFYPGTDFADATSYARFGAGRNKDDWRRENVNELIKEIQRTVKTVKPRVRFGVSPFAIWQNLSSSPLGSDTRGNEAYITMYADTRRWVKEGWMDYICPQIYWHMGFNIADYTKLLDWWADICRGTNVDLYIGLAAYKESGDYDGWTRGEIVRQLTLNATKYPDLVKGNVFFRYRSLDGALGQQIREYYNSAAEPPVITVTTLGVSQPSANVSIVATGYNIVGASDPNKPLLMNGQPVTNRTREGFFNVFVPLNLGENVFRFTQEAQSDVVRTITRRNATAAAVPTMPAVAISNAFPSQEEFVSAEDTITLRATAPVGSKVTVNFNGQTFELTNDNPNRQASANSIVSTSYSYRYRIPETMNTASIIELGSPAYTMTYNNRSYNMSGAAIKLINKNAPFYATVTAASAWAYPSKTTDGGSDVILVKGQRDAITAISGSWVRLATGMWIETQNVSSEQRSERINNVLTSGTYVQGANIDSINWNSAHYPASRLTFNGTKLTVYFGLQTVVPPLALSEADIRDKTMFKDVGSGVENGVPYYSFTVKDSTRIEGYYLSHKDGVFSLNVRKPRVLATGDKPLNGFAFVVDAGHGERDTGALGPLGMTLAEKELNLTNSAKLAARLSNLGAEVILTRVDDSALTLHERVDINLAVNPDMFISMHVNSVAETTDATNIRGITYWYRNPGSKLLADHLINETFLINPLTTRRMASNQANFYVCRAAWSPSVIVEASFICNIEDYSWLINPRRQDEMADAIAKAVLSYYGG